VDTQTRNRGRNWKVLCWNIGGINSKIKWNAIRNRIQESSCDIICLQETKREDFDSAYIRNFCPVVFDSFNFVPLVGTSGGIPTIWKSNKFSNGVSEQICTKYRTNIIDIRLFLDSYQHIYTMKQTRESRFSAVAK
jgi:exonuclease III